MILSRDILPRFCDESFQTVQSHCPSLVPRPPRPTGRKTRLDVHSAELLLQILGPSVKRPLKKYVLYNERPGKDVLRLDQEFEATVPDRLRP